MTKDEKIIIDFFKNVKKYDEAAFKYILNHKTYKFNDKYDINLITDNKKLKGFMLDVPIIVSNKDKLVTVYLYAKALNYYKKLGKQIKDDVTVQILPLTLIKLYAELYLGEKAKKEVLMEEYEKALKSDDISFLLAFNLQFDISDDYSETNNLLIPDKFYVDDLNALKQSCILKKNDILK